MVAEVRWLRAQVAESKGIILLKYYINSSRIPNDNLFQSSVLVFILLTLEDSI